MTSLSLSPSPRLSPSPAGRYTPRTTRPAIHRLPTPPVASSSSPGRRVRSDSPAPMALHPADRGRAAREGSCSDEEEFPPSISQRHVSRNRVAKGREGEKGKLMLPVDSDRVIKEKRSFERTRKWAREAEHVRKQRMERAEPSEENEDNLEALASDISLDGSGSTSSPIPPRTPSPAPSSHAPPQLSLTLPGTHIPILSIDEIVRLHSGSAQTAEVAAKDRARKELGLAPSPRPQQPATESAASDNSKPSTPRPSIRSRTNKSPSTSPPEIPKRTSSSPTAVVHVIPSRSSSIASQMLRTTSASGNVSSPATSPARSSAIPVEKGSSAYPTPASGRARQSTVSLSQPHPARSQTTLHSSPAVDSLTPASRARPSKARSSTAPPTTPATEQIHEMALHLRSAMLNKSLTFPRPYPDRPLTVSYAEVGKPDGYPVLIFLGVGCVRYLIALYDQLALVYGLRLICVDRWGYGKTDQVDQVDRGLIEWSGVIGQVVRKLGISRFQVVAHSAGTPYAMAVARRYPDMIRGRLHLLAPWVGQDHDTVSKWLKWVPGGVIRTATAADHKLQTYFLGKAPRLQYAPISFDAQLVQPIPGESGRTFEPPAEELEESTKAPNLIRRASTVFSNSKPRSRSIYGTAASASTINLSLPTFGFGSPTSGRRVASTGSPTPGPESPSTLGRSPGLKNLKTLANRMSSQVLSGPPSSDSRGTASSGPSSGMLATPDQSMEISPSAVDFGLGEGFGSFATDLELAMPIIGSTSKAGRSIRLGSDSSSSAITSSRSGSIASVIDGPISALMPLSSMTSLPALPESRFPSDTAFSTALSQASHAECEPGTTSDILRIILNKPHRARGFRYEDVTAITHVWVGEDDRIISKESIKWMEEVCGSTVDRRVGVGHNLMSIPGVLCDLFKCLGEEARTGCRMEEGNRETERAEREEETRREHRRREESGRKEGRRERR